MILRSLMYKAFFSLGNGNSFFCKMKRYPKMLKIFWLFFLFLQTSFMKFMNCSCSRYERDAAFDGIVSAYEHYYINSYEGLSFSSCTLMCHQSAVTCVGYLYNFMKKMSCKMLKVYLSENDKMSGSFEDGWEYRSKSEKLSLGKNVSASSKFPYMAIHLQWDYLVDGIINSINKFATGYELYPWVTIDLHGPCVIKNVIMYNRVDAHGRWLHNVEVRVGNSSSWDQMTTCGTFLGPSVTGAIHNIECSPSLYGHYVTVKITKPNYITDDGNAYGGNNIIVLEEVEVYGLYL